MIDEHEEAELIPIIAPCEENEDCVEMAVYSDVSGNKYNEEYLVFDPREYKAVPQPTEQRPVTIPSGPEVIDSLIRLSEDSVYNNEFMQSRRGIHLALAGTMLVLGSEQKEKDLTLEQMDINAVYKDESGKLYKFKKCLHKHE